MKFQKILFSWIYKKNWQFDHLSNHQKDMISFGTVISILILFITVPGLLWILELLTYSIVCFLFLFIFILFTYFSRIKYLNGHFDSYIPEQIQAQIQKKIKDKIHERIKKEKSYHAWQEAQEADWRLPHLKTLGLKSQSTSNDIKLAYRRLAMKLHPDRNPTPEAESQFKIIKTAYEKLTSPNEV
jgi:hypothetical protein